jgi:hypothetical protein
MQFREVEEDEVLIRADHHCQKIYVLLHGEITNVICKNVQL